jgi:hypothetical protein
MTRIAGSGIHQSAAWIPVSESAPKCDGSATLWLANMRMLDYLSNCDDHAEELLRSVEQGSVLRRVSNLWKGELF